MHIVGAKGGPACMDTRLTVIVFHSHPLSRTQKKKKWKQRATGSNGSNSWCIYMREYADADAQGGLGERVGWMNTGPLHCIAGNVCVCVMSCHVCPRVEWGICSLILALVTMLHTIHTARPCPISCDTVCYHVLYHVSYTIHSP